MTVAVHGFVILWAKTERKSHQFLLPWIFLVASVDMWMFLALPGGRGFLPGMKKKKKPEARISRSRVETHNLVVLTKALTQSPSKDV